MLPLSFHSVFAVIAQAAEQKAPSSLMTLPYLLFMAVIFYFLLIRPQQKRAKEQAALIAAVKTGDRIVTTGGLHGIISNARSAEDKTVLVKFAENVKIEVEKAHIASVAKTTAAEPEKAVLPAKSVL